MPLCQLAEVLGTVRVLKRESLAIDRLWQASQQGRLAKVSREQFETYYTNQKSGIGVWVGAAELWQSPITLSDFARTWSSLAATAADSTINRRSDKGSTEHRSLQLTERYCVRDDLTECAGKCSILGIEIRIITNHEFPITKNLPVPCALKPTEHLLF